MLDMFYYAVDTQQNFMHCKWKANQQVYKLIKNKIRI